jgi:formate hydrogenlyase subunit 6/NADH:ubiquinone oxidoreductase subunit I
MSEKIKITVDGRPVKVKKGSMLLDSIRSMGIPVPTLCNHPSLEPNGECRLCVVEITHPDWNGWSNLVTSCLYPAAPGLQVSTRSERVRETRRTLLELYLSQYPDAEIIYDLARNEGVDTTPFPIKEDADRCVLCGLCTRVCQELSVGAIAPLSRGTEKKVGPKPDLVAEDCTACGACAHVCPTGHIQMPLEAGKFLIWNREFDIPVCKVATELCRGCGICEEVCPWDIPRVTPSKQGDVVAHITPTYCTGCGICAGSCPTGAIQQDKFPDETLSGFALNPDNLKNQTVVFACSRSLFALDSDGIIQVPCIGRVTIENLLECMARGADGIMMMCRDQATCPFGPGGKRGEACAAVADELCVSAGLGGGRISYRKPELGLDGPDKALAEFKAAHRPSPLREAYQRQQYDNGGMDRALHIMRWLRHRPELESTLPQTIRDFFEPVDTSANAILYLDDLPDLDLLLSLTMSEWRLSSVFGETARILKEKGIAFTPVMTSTFEKQPNGLRVIRFCSTGEMDCAFHFQITHRKRRTLIASLQLSQVPFQCECPHTFAQYKLLNRQGAWQATLSIEPALDVTDTLRLPAGDTWE